MSRSPKTRKQKDQLLVIGKRLEEIPSGQKQSQITSQLGVCRVTLSRYITYGIDSIDTLERVSACLGVSYVELLCDDVTKRQEYLPCACPSKHAGQELRRLREQQNITQDKFAEKLEISTRTLQRYEEQGIPNISCVINIAVKCELSIMQLLCDRV